MKQRSRAGSWSAFERRYEPINGDDGTPMRTWDDSAFQDVDERRVWTVVDCDGRLYLTPGFATVNYMGRVLCAKPWPESELSNTGYTY